MERLNIEALAALTTRDKVQVRTFPADLVAAARKEATGVLAELAGKNPAARKVHDAYVAFRDKIAPWSRISLQAVLESRQV
jgi:TRAP-type mannitol/chloroaromatic compound transport system substrate-binding protein